MLVFRTRVFLLQALEEGRRLWLWQCICTAGNSMVLSTYQPACRNKYDVDNANNTQKRPHVRRALAWLMEKAGRSESIC